MNEQTEGAIQSTILVMEGLAEALSFAGGAYPARQGWAHEHIEYLREYVAALEPTVDPGRLAAARSYAGSEWATALIHAFEVPVSA